MVDNPDNSPTDFAKLAADCCAVVQTDALRRLAVSLGLSVGALQRLRVGWSKDRRGWTFPMQDATGQVTGIRLRLAGGRKLSVKGSKAGLFVPIDLDAGGRLLVCEGPTDCAALLDLGFNALGRPSCTGEIKHLSALVQTRRPAELVIVADADAPGQRGAASLAAVLVAYCPVVRIIEPPPGIKDACAWVRCGATAADLETVIEAAPVRRLEISTRTRSRKAGYGKRRTR